MRIFSFFDLKNKKLRLNSSDIWLIFYGKENGCRAEGKFYVPLYCIELLGVRRL